jgi:hypothetical protein
MIGRSGLNFEFVKATVTTFVVHIDLVCTLPQLPHNHLLYVLLVLADDKSLSSDMQASVDLSKSRSLRLRRLGGLCAVVGNGYIVSVVFGICPFMFFT